MRSLRKRIIRAASELILSVHRATTARDDFIPPIIASSRAFIGGCTIATSISKRWTSASHHFTDLLRCTEVLTLFCPHWKGGHNYLQVWRTITELLDTA
jgi:hypothetical protein